jgi:CCR4-NOT transcription complex subunit 6
LAAAARSIAAGARIAAAAASTAVAAAFIAAAAASIAASPGPPPPLPRSSHAYCAPELLEWAHRGPRLAAEIGGYDADLLFLQEIEEEALAALLAALGGVYAGVRHVRPPPLGGGRLPRTDGAALLYRASMFAAERCECETFRDALPPHYPPALRVELAERDDGAAMAVLRHLPSGALLVAASAHLHWHPLAPHVKVAQAELLAAAAARLAAAAGGGGPGGGPVAAVPVLIAGDFNSLWRKYASDPYDTVRPGQFLTSGVYQLLASGSLDARHPDHASQRMAGGGGAEGLRHALPGGLALVSAHMAAAGFEPALTTRTSGFEGALDYVWLSRAHWRVAELLELPYEQAHETPACGIDGGFGPLPDARWPSDHIAIGATLVLLQV